LKTEHKNKDVLVRYLLGDLPASERESLELGYFADPETLQALHLAEEDLIDAYVRGRLSPLQQKQFEDFFLDSGESRERVAFARTLLSAMRGQRKTNAERPVMGVSVQTAGGRRGVAALLSVAAVLAIFFAVQDLRLREQLRKAQAEQSELRRQIEQLQQENAANGVKAGPDWPALAQGESISVLLLPGLLRDGGKGSQVVALPAEAASVFLALKLEEDRAPLYRAILQTPEGERIRSFEELRSHPVPGAAHAVVLGLAAQSLNRGDYVARLFTAGPQTQELHPYTFTVIR